MYSGGFHFVVGTTQFNDWPMACCCIYPGFLAVMTYWGKCFFFFLSQLDIKQSECLWKITVFCLACTWCQVMESVWEWKLLALGAKPMAMARPSNREFVVFLYRRDIVFFHWDEGLQVCLFCIFQHHSSENEYLRYTLFCQIGQSWVISYTFAFEIQCFLGMVRLKYILRNKIEKKTKTFYPVVDINTQGYYA